MISTILANVEIRAITCILVLLTGWIFYFWVHRKFRIRLLRYKLFVIQHNLLTTAHRLEIPFDTPAFKAVREHVYTLIGLSDKMNLGLCLLGIRLYIFGPKKDSTEEILHEELAPSCYPEEFKKSLIETYEKALITVGWHIIMGAPILIPLVIFSIIMTWASEMRKRIHTRTVSTFSDSDYVSAPPPIKGPRLKTTFKIHFVRSISASLIGFQNPIPVTDRDT